jgi:hypothetical protein
MDLEKQKLECLRERIKYLNKDITLNTSFNLNKDSDYFISIPSFYDKIENLKEYRDMINVLIKELENAGI